MWQLTETLLKERAHIAKYFSTNCPFMVQINKEDTKKVKHRNCMYMNEGAFNSRTLLAKHLEENILYYEPKRSGLLVINKPYGLPNLPGEADEISLSCVLPELADKLSVSRINVIKSCGR